MRSVNVAPPSARVRALAAAVREADKRMTGQRCRLREGVFLRDLDLDAA
jgi:uncharacterized protein YjhX (UPF0386 family)